MTWSYIPYDEPGHTDRDKARFYAGDVCADDPLVQDEDFDFALSEFANPKLAAALVLRSLAARFARDVSCKVGDVALTNVAARMKGYLDLADELDPEGLTKSEIVIPKFGGLAWSEKEELLDDTDAVQPAFTKGQNDIPGGPDDGDVVSELTGRTR